MKKKRSAAAKAVGRSEAQKSPKQTAPSVNDLFASILDSDDEAAEEVSTKVRQTNAYEVVEAAPGSTTTAGELKGSGVDEEVADDADETENGDDDVVKDEMTEDSDEKSDDSALDHQNGSDEDDEGTAEDLQHFGLSLEKLKDSDPEFYKFLHENDKELLDNRLAESEDEDAASDHESAGVAARQKSLSPLKQIQQLATDLSQGRVKTSFKQLSSFLHEAVDAAVKSAKESMAVANPEVFNSLVAMCMEHVPTAIDKFVKVDSNQDLSSNKKWVQIRAPMKTYLNSIHKLLCTGSSTSLHRALLRHLLALSSYISTFCISNGAISATCRHLVARLLRLWSTGDQQVRVLAFMLLYKLARRHDALLDDLLKKCYMSYVRTCAFTSATTWPDIHLMRRCLVELYQLSPSASYQRAFLFIRQLAIHLRNAKLDKHKFQVVYNWQFVHCLMFWSDLLSDTNSEELRLLVYPLVQIMFGTITLVPTRRHYPLRFHVLTCLTKLSAATGQFVPVLPHILQVFDHIDLSRGRRASDGGAKRGASLRLVNLHCSLRLSACQLRQASLSGVLFDAALSSLLSYICVEAESAALPELLLPVERKLQQLAGSCRVRSHAQQLRTVLHQLRTASQHVSTWRNSQSQQLVTAATAGGKQKQFPRAPLSPFRKFSADWHARSSRQHQQAAVTALVQDGKISVRDEPTPSDLDSGLSDTEDTQTSTTTVAKNADDDGTGTDDDNDDGADTETNGEVDGDERDDEMLESLDKQDFSTGDFLSGLENEEDTVQPLICDDLANGDERPRKRKQKKSNHSNKTKRPKKKAVGVKAE